MTDLITVARPYAKALYSLAAEQLSVQQWSESLTWLAAMAGHPAFAASIAHPKYTAEEVKIMMLDVLGARGNEEVKRFLDVLLKNGRLRLLPKIAEQFEVCKAQAEGVVHVVLETAFPISPFQQAELIDAISKKYGKFVQIEVRLHPELIGGVRLLIGDNVTDASIRGKLKAMLVSLKN